MEKDFTGTELWDYEGDRVIKVEKYSEYHTAYECRVYEMAFDEDGNEEMTGDGELTLLTQADLERIK